MTSHSELVEKVARAIHEGRNGKGCTPWNKTVAQYKDAYRVDAQAAIATILAELMEPSEAMETAYFNAHAKAETVFADFKDSWRAALTASPLPGGE